MSQTQTHTANEVMIDITILETVTDVLLPTISIRPFFILAAVVFLFSDTHFRPVFCLISRRKCNESQLHTRGSVCGIYQPRLAGYKTCISISSLPSLALGGLACLAGLQRAQGTKDGTCSHPPPPPPPPPLHHHGFLLSPSPFIRIWREYWAGGGGGGGEILRRGNICQKLGLMQNGKHTLPK